MSYLSNLLELWDLDSTSQSARKLALIAGYSSAATPSFTTLTPARDARRSNLSSSSSGPKSPSHKYGSLSSVGSPSVFGECSFSSCNELGVMSVLDTQTDLSKEDCLSQSCMANQCTHCNSHNAADANWCTECGKALLGDTYGIGYATHEDGLLQEQDSLELDDVIGSCTDCENVQDTNTKEDITDTCPDCSVRAVEDMSPLNLKAYSSKTFASRPTNHSDTGNVDMQEKHKGLSTPTWTEIRSSNQYSNIQKTPLLQEFDFPEQFPTKREQSTSRHWKSSSHYMWRKPTTLNQKQHKSKETGITMPTEIAISRSIPLLDLQNLQPMPEHELVTGSSTRRRILSNKVYYSHDVRAAKLESLPDELLLHIMTYLSQSDLVRCMYVCCRLYSVATDQSLWKCITLSRKMLQRKHLVSVVMQYPLLESVMFDKCTHTDSSLDLQVFFGKLPTLKKLKCVMCDLGPCTGDRMLLCAAINCPHLCVVDFDWTTLSEMALLKSIQIIPRLETLVIQQHGNVTTKTLQSILTHHSQWLKKLNIGMTTAEDLLAASGNEVVPCLETLVATFNKMELNVVEDVQLTFPLLRHLFIRHYSTSPLTVDVAAGLSCLSLCTLHVKLLNSSALGVGCCEHIAQMTSLRELGLDCVTDDGLEALCCGSLSLEVLDLSNSAITVTSLSTICKSYFKLTLKELKLSGCVGMNKPQTDLESRFKGLKTDNILELTGNCPKLRVLKVSGLDLMSAPDLTRTQDYCKIVF